MPVLLLTFELNQKDTGACIEIENKLSIFESCLQIGQTSWVIETVMTPAQVLNEMWDYFDADDSVFVFKLDQDWEAAASFDQHSWLESRLD